jgi:endonuclease YncB( thermonuclease family)
MERGAKSPNLPGMSLTRRGFALGTGGLMLTACSAAPDLQAGEKGRIARVSDGDVLALDTGQRVRLVEIEAPQPGFDGREDQPFAVEARAMLSTAGLGRNARLFYGGLSRDRYDRALAHVIAADETGRDVWLNGYMVRQGGARVRTFPDNARRARALLKFEDEARKAKRGLWNVDYWQVRETAEIEGAPGFALVEGELLAVEAGAGPAAAKLEPRGFRLLNLAGLGKPDVELRLEAGRRIRVRGRIETETGAALVTLTHWAQVEMA